MRSAVLPILSPASTSGANNARVAHNVPIIVRRHFVELLTLSTLVAALVYLLLPRTGDIGRSPARTDAASGKKAIQQGTRHARVRSS